MNELAKIGKKRTILISISILLVSIHTIYFYHSIRPEIETKKLIQQVIRFCLTVGLLYLIYIGKYWAKNLAIILFVLATIVAIYSIVNSIVPLIMKTPLIVMSIAYSFAIYHFQFSKSFKEFINFKEENNH
jgi:glucan phosphoethanolaminetransferase (alkaline phosphatase superfamily)